MSSEKRKREYTQAPDYLVNVFESSPVALISLDTRLRIIMFNRAAQELTGFSRPDVAGRRINKIIPLKRLKNIIDTMRQREMVSIDGYLTKFKGSGKKEIPVRLRISPLLDSNENLLGVLLMATDLREVKQLQTKLLEAERLAAITETAISINHEINNPLCSILGNTQLILMDRERLEPRTVRKLQSIEKQIVRIQGIAERLSRITRPVLKEYVGGRRMLDVERSEVNGSSCETERRESVDEPE